jgi:glyoxylase I family protein
LRARPADVIDVFVYVVGLNLAIEYVPSVLSESFTLSLLTAVLLKVALEVVIGVVHATQSSSAASTAPVEQEQLASGCLSRLGSVRRMPIKLENVGIAVRDLDATIAFFTDLGLTVLGRDTVSGEWTDTAVGLDGNHSKIAMLQTPDGNGRLELFEYIHPEAIQTEPTLPNEIGMHRVAFSVDDIDAALAIAARHGCRPLRGVATYEDVYKLTYLRGPSGILVMLAEELKKG